MSDGQQRSPSELIQNAATAVAEAAEQLETAGVRTDNALLEMHCSHAQDRCRKTAELLTEINSTAEDGEDA